MMTNSKARNLGKKELINVFRSCQIKDGLDANKISEKFSFWYGLERTGERGNYIVFETINSEPVHRADDRVFSREFYCQIDIFSLDSFESEKLQKFIEMLEDALEKAGFEVEMKDEMYETDTQLFHLLVFVSKYYGGN